MSDPQIRTIEELAALPVDTYARDVDGKPVLIVAAQFKGYARDLLWPTVGMRCADRHAAAHLPLTVLYQPEQQPTSVPGWRDVPYRVATPGQFVDWAAEGGASTYVIESDGRRGLALAWFDEDGNAHAIRPVDEEDGPWQELPEHVRASLAVRADDLVDASDPEAFTPFTVLHHDGLPWRAALIVPPDGEAVAAAAAAIVEHARDHSCDDAVNSEAFARGVLQDLLAGETFDTLGAPTA